MILIKIMAAIFAVLFLCILIDLINGVRGKPSHYTENMALIFEGGQWLCIGLGLVLFCIAAVFICGMFIFG